MTQLIKGKWYSKGEIKYLVGGNACGGNLYVIRLYKSGRVSSLDCIYRIQNKRFKLLNRAPRLSSKYDRRIKILMEGGLGLTGTR